MKHVLLLLIACCGVAHLTPGQAQGPAPKREFRAAWIATVGNIDWPSAKGLSAAQQQAEFISIINQHRQAGLNAVVVQVRSVCDALYASPLEPWAEVLTGRQGQSPGYDPLAFMLAECHRRGLELHAWFNPYRAVSNVQTATLDPTHVVRQRPDWLLAQGNLRILNPGLPAVRQYVTRVVLDVLRRYDIDGVHFDDYFYPYPVTGQSFSDDSTFAAFPRGFSSRAAWRRDNVDLLVKQVSDSIQAVKPWVKFGISPFGIWQNRSPTQPLGSATGGLEGYTDIYADSRKWIQQGWLDYVTPQLYWYIGLPVADYAVLAPWWQDAIRTGSFPDRHLYIGQAAYRVGNDPAAQWNQAAQMPTQLRQNRQAGIPGSIFYNTSSLLKNPLGLRDSLRLRYYNRPALRPLMPWKDNTAPPAPTGLSVQVSGSTVTLRWTRPATAPAELARARQFVVYRFEPGQPTDLSQAAAIRTLTDTDTTAATDTDLRPGLAYRYVVTSLNRLHTESGPSAEVIVPPVLGLTEPSAFLLRCDPNPINDRADVRYTLTTPTHLRLTLLDGAGRPVRLLVNGLLAVGEQTVVLNASGLPTGLYVLVLTTDSGQRETRRVLIGR
jgi:uncharacterized lipoprotein YddW (UPF0748 family)